VRGLGVIVVALAACGTPTPDWTVGVDAGPCVPYMVPAGTNLMTPAVSFTADVMPVFQANCASASCHGLSQSTTGLALGNGATNATTAYTRLVGPMSGELATMPYVTAGEPGNSFLMHKMDADLCSLDAACSGGSCQRPMPYDVGVLPVDQRDIVRRWIAQGASSD
jgi:hypothetical protein